MSQIIIFGAGNFGRRALSYYGEEKVFCFADNNMQKKGTFVEGKKIIGFDELKSIAKDYRIVIATARNIEIKKQLDEAGIVNYICYTPSYEHFMDNMTKRIKNRKFSSILLYGVDNDTYQIIEVLKALELGEFIKGAVPSPYTEGELPCLNGVHIYRKLEDVIEKQECYVVASCQNNIALEAELKIRYGNDSVINPYKQFAYYDTDEIVFNPYLSMTTDTTEETWNTEIDLDMTKQAVRAYVEVVKKKVPLFEYVEIETINKCNGTCSFCPVNKLADPRIETKMSMQLFTKIIDELSEINYKGELSLFSNNEPLLDERIIDLHKYAREHLPDARIHMFSNGTLFTLPIFMELMKYLDELIIDNYHQDLKLIRPAEEIKAYVEEHQELRRKVTIVLRKREEILTSRGGDAPNRENIRSFPKETCALPFEQLIIRPDGKVSLCCNDPIGKETLGDATEKTLKEIWYGEKYNEVRQKIVDGRGEMAHCKYCDTFYLY